MTLLQAVSNRNNRAPLSNINEGGGAKYNVLSNAATTATTALSTAATKNHNNNGLNPFGLHSQSQSGGTSFLRSVSESQPHSLTKSHSASPSKKKDIEIVTLLSDDDDDDVHHDAATTTTTNADAADQDVDILKKALSDSIDREANAGSQWLPELTEEAVKALDTAQPRRRGKSRKKSSRRKRREAADSEHTATALDSERGSRSKSRSKKRKKQRRESSREREQKRKRKRSPSVTPALSAVSLISTTASDALSFQTTGSDVSYKGDGGGGGGASTGGDVVGGEASHQMVTRRQRRKRTCNIDKEFDAEEQRIKLQEDTVQEPVSGNAYIVAYAESLHLDEMQMRRGEVFPVLREMPRSALIGYCDYYKLRHSKRSKDNRLLQIVTKHFILHNREKNGTRSIDDMERDLFWHSICHQHNSEGAEQRASGKEPSSGNVS